MIEIMSGPEMSLILPIVLITIQQVRAILDRDGHECKFPGEHVCGGKMSVHHIEDKEDIPENIISVCQKGAHWGKLHNGATVDQKIQWAAELSEIAKLRTIAAYRRGWKFPTD
ncbi:MAG: hypothetical protein ABII21_00605 [bacterium]